MKTHPWTSALAALGLGLLTALAGCDRSAKTPAPDGAAPATPSPLAELDGLLLAEAPEGAIGPFQARSQARPGERIVLFGEIGGRKTGTFGDGLAVFFLADPTVVVNCLREHAEPGKGCPTPWDYCCTPKEKLTASLALVQVKSPDTGKVLPVSLKGWHGLRELSEVTVVGTVDEVSSPEALVVNLTGIHVIRP